MSDRVDRARGALLGLAAGDALGGLVEGWSPFGIRQIFGTLRDIPEQLLLDWVLDHVRDGMDRRTIERYVRVWRPPGVHSDDTQQALLLAYSLLETPGVSADDLVARLLRFSQPRTTEMPLGVFRGYGRGFAEAVDLLGGGTGVPPAGRASAGNGAAMRIAPVGLYVGSRFRDLARAVVELCLPTHSEVRALAAAGAVAFAVARLSESDPPIQPASFLYDVVDFAERLEQFIHAEYADRVDTSRPLRHQFSRALLQLDGLWRVELEAAIDRIGQFASDKTSRLIRRGNAGFCLCSVPACFLYFLRRPDNLEAAVVDAANGGGDADTIAAMTGALAGALHGVGAIPSRWVQALRSRQLIDQVAVALAHRPTPCTGLPDLYESEKALTLETHRFQADLLAELHRRLDASGKARPSRPAP